MLSLYLIVLTYYAPGGLDLSLRNLTGEWLHNVEECISGINGDRPKASLLQSYTSLDKLSRFCHHFFEMYLLAREQLVTREDKSYF